MSDDRMAATDHAAARGAGAPNRITQELIDRTRPFIPDLSGGAVRPRERPWQKWLDAELGLRDYWYPIEASRSIPEGGHKVVTPLGEEILLLRRAGRVFAIENRCCHRGARLSVKPLCLTDDSITCWLHTFTFSLNDGSIRTILNAPDSKLIGRPGIKSYPVEEAKGIIFVFIGDKAPHPLAEDVPPGLLDDDVAVYVADVDVDHSNWRLGIEGAFDPGHHFIHNWSALAINRGIPMSFGWVGKLDELANFTHYQAADGAPKGFSRSGSDAHMRFAATIPGEPGKPDTSFVLPMARGMTEGDLQALQEGGYHISVSAYLPAGVRIDPWPNPGITTGEFFVPRDAVSHYYIRYGTRRVASEAERIEWESGGLGELLWKIPNVDGFTAEDSVAREGVGKFYAEEDGYDRETLMGPDIEVLMWRAFASQHARGAVQEPKHVQGRFRKVVDRAEGRDAG